ncbi:MAG: transglutaminase-like domain-containing protein [Planctomycetia bacterium]|nr:transglutaminase-like domain-containing protein [Planctomycetia bacterium]
MSRSTRGTAAGGLLATLTALGLVGAAPATESWDAVFLAGSKVGHTQTWIEPEKDRGRDLLRVRIRTELSYRRLASQVTIKFEYGTIETPDGKVLRLDTRTTASDQEMRVYGDVIDGKMKLIFEGTGQRQEQVIDWPDDVRGPYAAEQSLSRDPIKPGEVRTLKMFMPDLNKICQVTLNARNVEDVPLGGGVNRKLLRIDQTTTLDGKPRPEFDQSLWVDSGGQVLKARTDTLGGLVVFRTTREGALARNAPNAQFDQITHSVIKVEHKILRPGATRDVRYRLTLKDDEPSQVVPTDRRQSMTPGSSRNAVILEVKTAGPDSGAPGVEAVDPIYLKPNALITSRDGRVIELTGRAVGNATDPWQKARRIEAWVAQNLKDKNFEVAFAPAAEVARNLSGDCTEHGVLVAAMCRAAGVPSRVVVGLVYAENLGGFGFHLWNEVYE